MVCTRGVRKRKCQWCGRQSTLQCDESLGDGKTCDAFMCPTHAERIGHNRDLCPMHSEARRESMRRIM